jgi:hypothetical protein
MNQEGGTGAGPLYPDFCCAPLLRVHDNEGFESHHYNWISREVIKANENWMLFVSFIAFFQILTSSFLKKANN